MFNVAVISLKKIIKFTVKLIIAVAIIAMIFCALKKSTKLGTVNVAYINLISSNIILSETQKNEKISAISILKSELVLFNEDGSVVLANGDEVADTVTSEDGGDNGEDESGNGAGTSKNIENSTDESNIGSSSDTNAETVTTTAETSTDQIYTQVISENNKSDVYTDTYGSVQIKNESSYELTEEMLTPNVEFNNKQDILIFHTHTCESYTPTEANSYVASGNYRTIDLNYSVAHVGDVLTDYLTGFGYNVTHNKTYHDYPAYNGSYTRSYQTVSSLLSGDAWTELVIDLHRDAIGSSSEYAPSVQIRR